MAVFIAADLDLVGVTFQFSQDKKTQVGTWMSNYKIAVVSDNQAREWLILLWTVVIKPWILVQDRNLK